MQKFFRRLKFYLIGVALGCVLVYFMLLKDRERPAWMPKGRVLEQIARSSVIFTDKASCALQMQGLSEEEIKTFITDNAQVDFAKSDTRRKPCPMYYIENKNRKNLHAKVEVCDSVSTVHWVLNTEKNADLSSCN